MSRAKERLLQHLTGTLNHLLQTNNANDAIAEAHAGRWRYTQTLAMLQAQFAEALPPRFIRCNKVYNEYVWKGSVIRNIH